MQGKVEICGVNTAKLPVLKAAETRALLERARAGDREAREELIAGNLRLVLSVVQKFAGRGESMDDLFQVGVIGLIKAVDAFDLSQNVQFSTYGVPMIAGELRRFLRDHSALRVSRSMRDTAYRVLQAKEKLTARDGREPGTFNPKSNPYHLASLGRFAPYLLRAWRRFATPARAPPSWTRSAIRAARTSSGSSRSPWPTRCAA